MPRSDFKKLLKGNAPQIQRPSMIDKKDIHISTYKSPVGELIIGELDGQICLCDWKHRKKRRSIDRRIKGLLGGQFVEENSPIIERAKEQLTEYFEKKRQEFDLPLLFVGSDHQKSVWDLLVQIPYGKTKTYGR